jgi:signal transduction histidine kinase
MNQNQAFRVTRWRLAMLYAGVMGAILTVCSLAAYRMMVEDHWQTIDQKLEALVGTLHDGLEPDLQTPGQIEPIANQLLPGLCLANRICSAQAEQRHITGIVQQKGYYVRLLDPSGLLLASVGELPTGLPLVHEGWQTFQTADGSRYRQISVLLQTGQRPVWGYIQMGRSLQQLDAHLASVQLLMLAGLPAVMLVICAASWWLAGLAMQPVYQSYRQIQQFTVDAAHELRTPITAIQVTIESSLQEELAAEAHHTLQILARQNHRLARLVQDLLLLSRMDLKGLPPDHQPCCLNDLIDDLLEGFSALATAAELSLISEIQVSHLLVVLGEEEQLYRLIANLVMNAIQYTPADGKIILRLLQEQSFALIQVQDSGIGIGPEHQQHIFDRFYRVSSDRSRQTGGSGLGLAIAAAIAKTHRGSLQVRSERGQGSLFILRLPLILRIVN